MVRWLFAQAAIFAPLRIGSTIAASDTTCVVSVTSRRERCPPFGIRLVCERMRKNFRTKIGDVSGRNRGRRAPELERATVAAVPHRQGVALGQRRPDLGDPILIRLLDISAARMSRNKTPQKCPSAALGARRKSVPNCGALLPNAIDASLRDERRQCDGNSIGWRKRKGDGSD
jgi:hypothetical protein